MASTKHSKFKTPTDKDLKRNPGIGTSPGTSKGGDLLDGENTFEGDVRNDTTSAGGVRRGETGRTNK
ncbi:hypothetical protein [Nitratireductor sp. ZSWI3]|uniref:hypothetical protein n=1 Tax=Nitratireductor sp. ZSWI3 TaxID=2966359 RepID=UPI00214F7656|nr:hypothetical protein [Nitratireductor sp. ZSWI3]MCR4264659.1 hypothetical protein [Nitratireductor sp. ZSWI3]